MKSLPLCMLLLATGLAYVAPAKYVMEVYFVADPQAVNNYVKWGYGSTATAQEQFKKELYNNMDDVNEMYKSLLVYGLDIEVRIAGLDFVNYRLYNSTDFYKDDLIPTRNSLIKIKKYVKDHKLSGYDVAVLLTGNDIINTFNHKESTLGIAKRSSACNLDESVAVVEVNGNNGLNTVIAHELAHTLSCYHDGYRNNCSGSKGNVMTRSTDPSFKNRWEFSSCSAAYIANYIKELDEQGNNCLLDTHTKPHTPTRKVKDLLDRDAVCKRNLGNKSYMCKFYDYYEGEMRGDVMCHTLYCADPSGERAYCHLAYVTEGMVCDAGKRCRHGKCVTAPKDFPTPRNIDPGCVFGDSKNPNIFSDKTGGCSTVIHEGSKKYCYLPSPAAECCDTCKKLKSDVPGCEYGDRSSFCELDDLDYYCGGPNRKKCCKTCRNYRG